MARRRKARACSANRDPKRGGKSCDAAGEGKLADPIRKAALYTRAQKALEEAKAADAAHPTICGRCTSNLFGTGEVRSIA